MQKFICRGKPAARILLAIGDRKQREKAQMKTYLIQLQKHIFSVKKLNFFISCIMSLCTRTSVRCSSTHTNFLKISPVTTANKPFQQWSL